MKEQGTADVNETVYAFYNLAMNGGEWVTFTL
jgi:hypothetical protein